MTAPPLRRLFVANRGEVAARIAKTCDRLGIVPVFAVSEVDARQPMYRNRETMLVGASQPKHSYLNGIRLVQAAAESRCAALHPGWGFLSEDPQFSALCETHGLTFVGPPAPVTQRLSRKSLAKDLMRSVGVPVIPGSDGVVPTADAAAKIAQRVGYPVLLKAESGGGGRGMRVVDDPAGLASAFEEAALEAKNAFGDRRLYLEKLILGGRHVELQLLADRYGNVVHLGERDCSIQRNHQKLVEESPAPTVSRGRLEEVAKVTCEAFRTLGYVGAGTVEFLLEENGNLYFLEVNARLQVEHGVSELRTGIDLVEHQLRIAAGHRLPFGQADIQPKGVALECRINAEDPTLGFRPAPGTLSVFELPDAEGIRVDTHLCVGAEVPPHYDSLVCKLLSWGTDRDQARERMEGALQRFRCEPLPTTKEFHQAMVGSDMFRQHQYDTTTDLTPFVGGKGS